MKIIKKGSLPEKKIYEVSCNNCKTVFQFEAGEAKVTHDMRDGSYLAITCPLSGCGHNVTIACS